MRFLFSLRAVVAAVALLLAPAALAPAAASTTVMLTKTQFDTSSPVVKLETASGVMFAHASPALLTFTGYANDVFAYCIDPFTSIPNGTVSPPANYLVTSISQILSALPEANVRKIGNLALTGSTAFGYDAFVTQAAIWTYFPGLTVSSENAAFQAAFLARAAGAQLATDAQLAQLIGYESIDKQGQVQDFVTAVPEPATWAMLIVGFGAVGLAVRRRERRSVVFA